MAIFFDWSLWVLIATLQLALAARAFFSQYKKSWFAAFIYCIAAKSAILLLVYTWNPDPRLYSLLISTMSLALILPLAGTFVEIWREVFSSSEYLPRGTAVTFVKASMVIAAATPLLVALARARTPLDWLNSLMNVGVMPAAAGGAVLVAMVVYSKYLGCWWKLAQARIVGGFCIATGIQTAMILLAGHGWVSVLPAQRFSQVVYLVTLWIWYRVFASKPEPMLTPHESALHFVEQISRA